MSLLNLVVILVLLMILIPMAKGLDLISKTYSPWVSAFLLGLVISMWFILRRYAGKALFPKCKNGICGPRDYEGVPVRPGDAGIPFKCKCGQRYLLKRNRFMLLGDDGQATPYKIKRQFYSRWTDDVVTNRIDTSTPPGAR
jgi:hypothetical protein